MTDKAPEQKDPTEAIKAEAKARRLDDGTVIVPLITDEGTVEITVLPAAQWWEGAVEHLVAGRISQWVDLAVDDAESKQRWHATRKRYSHLDAFLTAWNRATGEDPGESEASSSS